MTEKRYWTSVDESAYNCNSLIWENERELSIIEVLKLINEQHETITQLEKENKELRKEIKALSNGEADWLIEELI